jgi:ribonuclease R
MPKKRKPRSQSDHTRPSRPRPDDVQRVKDFLIRQGEKTIAAEILNFLSEHDGKAFRSREIAAELGYLSDDDLPGFWYVLHKLHEEGALDKDADRCYSLARSAAPLPEVIRVREALALHADTQVAPFVPPPKQRFKVGEIYEGTLKTHPNGYGLVSVTGYDEEIFLPVRSSCRRCTLPVAPSRLMRNTRCSSSIHRVAPANRRGWCTFTAAMSPASPIR